MSPEKRDELERVISRGLCTRCGTCAGLGEGAVRWRDRDGECLPEISGELDEASAARIVAGCSGAEVDFRELAAGVFGPGPEPHPLLGRFEGLWIAHAADPAIRRAGGSGGVLTEIALSLLEEGHVRGVVVTSMDEERPWRPRSRIATSRQEVIAAAQSKYVITTVNEILPALEAFEGDLAFVGLPCQVHSIRKLQAAGDPSVRNVRWVLGPYCGNTLHGSSIRSLLRSRRAGDLGDIASLRFRDGEWPGNLRIELRGGGVIEMPKFHANYLIPFHIVKRCLLCVDLANELTDLSVGDAWAPRYEERGRGFSIVVARSHQGVERLEALGRAGRLELEPIEPEAAVRMHSHGFDLKKRGAVIRIALRRLTGRAAPRYGLPRRRIPLARRGLELVISSLFAILSTRVARRAVGLLSPDLLGRLFVRFRTLWKRATRGIKAGRLQD